ncbi:IS3 family transposase [Apilactobacillus xinyiensis]|uniref:IS3 family transposase n=1 Tax=Apilactobacillus xinyiensis TaxID=2841032 RepID=UPI001C7D8175|nr:IS3 family transposase [Apilactobacillus xinyiensis]MCL0318324.1 IS3 family transposase [Apilactobacillus xinyiensis]
MPKVYPKETRNKILDLAIDQKVSIKKISKDYNISINTVKRWVNESRKAVIDGKTYSLQRYNELEKHIKNIEKENKILKFALSEGVDWFNNVDKLLKLVENAVSQGYQRTNVLKLLNVPTSTYYDWLNYEPTATRKQDEKLKPIIKDIWEKNNREYGVPRIQSSLRKQNIYVGNRRLKRLMNELNIHAASPAHRVYHKPNASNSKTSIE